MVKSFSVRGSYRPSLLILYGPIISTDDLSQGMTSASLADKSHYFKLCFFHALMKSPANLNMGKYFVP